VKLRGCRSGGDAGAAFSHAIIESPAFAADAGAEPLVISERLLLSSMGLAPNAGVIQGDGDVRSWETRPTEPSVDLMEYRRRAQVRATAQVRTADEHSLASTQARTRDAWRLGGLAAAHP
jgi:hypothetical protein